MTVVNPDRYSSTLLNAIRTTASPEYQARVPIATQKNLAEVGNAILNWQAGRNEFTQALFNRIARVEMANELYENPLKEFKRQAIEYGQTIEEVYIDLIKETAFEPTDAEVEVFKRNLPNILSAFHEVNRKGNYKTTVSESMLETAFTDESGMMNLVSAIINQLTTSSEVDEFLYMKNIIHMAMKKGQIKTVEIDAITDNASAKLAMVEIKTISNMLTFMSKDFNFADVTTRTKKEDQIILISPRFDALIDVELLATAFNMDKADVTSRKIVIDNFGGTNGIECMVVDVRWLYVADKLFRTENIYNPQGLYTNYWLHVWQVLSSSPFRNAVAFVTTSPVLTSISLKPETATVYAGQVLQLTTEATGTGYPSSKCSFTLDSHTSSTTRITSTGLLIIGEDETDTEIVVTATSTVDATKTDTAVITIVPLS